MSDTSKPGQQGDRDAKAKADRITAADNRETEAKEKALDSAQVAPGPSDLAEQESQDRPRRKRRARDPLTASMFRIEFNAVGTFLKGEKVTKEQLNAPDESLAALVGAGALKPLWGDEDEDEE